jgi:hypothetical protein
MGYKKTKGRSDEIHEMHPGYNLLDHGRNEDILEDLP